MSRSAIGWYRWWCSASGADRPGVEHQGALPALRPAGPRVARFWTRWPRPPPQPVPRVLWRRSARMIRPLAAHSVAQWVARHGARPRAAAAPLRLGDSRRHRLRGGRGRGVAAASTPLRRARRRAAAPGSRTAVCRPAPARAAGLARAARFSGRTWWRWSVPVGRETPRWRSWRAGAVVGLGLSFWARDGGDRRGRRLAGGNLGGAMGS